ncbi:MAG: NosD domain-containing protein, partial [Candidatus Thorarchaeota archaeon]
MVIESPNEATFAWIAWSDPGTYELFQNNSMIEEGDWHGSGAFKLHLLDLPDGLYNYTLSINDQANEIVRNQKFILVPGYLLVTPPESPQNLVIDISENSIELDWEAPVFDGNLPVIGYNVYRGSRPGALTLLAELGVVFNYTDNSITIGTINIYAVHAVNALGEGLPSNIVSNLESHNPIVINSNEDFQTQGWPGDGTEENPFMISGLNITSSLTCISISNVNVFVEIEGCIFANNPNEYHYGTFGIYLENVTNINIKASYTSRKERGIYFTRSADCTVNGTYIDAEYQGVCIENSRGMNVTDTTMKNENGWFGYGIYIWQSRDAYVSNCTFFDIDNGIFIDSSILCQISDCDFSRVYQGIILYDSASCLVYACTMTDLGGAGIRLRESVNCAFSNITLIGDGVSISGNNITTWNHMFNNVTIDHKLLGFFFDTVGATINATKYSQLFIVYCQEVSVEGHYDANMSYGMHVAFSDGLQIIDVSLSELILENTTNSRVYNITSIGKSGDIIISLCEDLLFENLTFQREYWQWGRIRFTDSDRITIRDSIIRTRDDAISLYGTNDCVLEKLVIDFNWRGIFIDFSRNCTIRNVTLASPWSAYGITLEYSTDSLLEDVTLIFCGVEIIGYELEHWIHTFNNVTANGKQLGYFYQVEYRTIEGNDYAQLFIVDSHDIVVQNASFSNITMGLQFAYSDNCRVTDVELSDLFGYAPNLFSCESIIIENLSFHDNSNPFIIQTSSDILIHHSQFNDSYGGIDVSVSSLNCTIVENSFENADTAIRISDSIGCSISRNSIINGWRGFALYGLELSYITDNQIVDCYEGIRLQYSTNNYVTNNTVRRVYRGLRIVGGQENQITNNRIFDCSSIGI